MNLRVGPGEEEAGGGGGGGARRGQRRGYSRRLQPHFLIRFGSVTSS